MEFQQQKIIKFNFYKIWHLLLSQKEAKCFTNCIKLKKIRKKVFIDCTSLVQESIPSSITKICDYAFCICRSLIGRMAFKKCQ